MADASRRSSGSGLPNRTEERTTAVLRIRLAVRRERRLPAPTSSTTNMRSDVRRQLPVSSERVLRPAPRITCPDALVRAPSASNSGR